MNIFEVRKVLDFLEKTCSSCDIKYIKVDKVCIKGINVINEGHEFLEGVKLEYIEKTE